MKHPFSSIISIVAGALMAIISGPGLHGQTYRIMPLGNSLTRGTMCTTHVLSPCEDISDEDAVGYREVLFDMLTSAGHDFDFVGSESGGGAIMTDTDHAGFPGIRDHQLASVMETGFSIYTGLVTPGPYLESFPADIILLHIGTNDMLAGDLAVDGVEGILDAIDDFETEFGVPVMVFLARIISTWGNPCNTDADVVEFNSNLDALVASRIASGDNIIVVDMECGAGLDYSADMIDLVHPNQAGYDKMGQAWYDSVDAYLNAIPLTPGGLTLGDETFSSIGLSWTDYADNETGFQIERSLTSSGGDFSVIATVPANTTSYTSNGLTPETRYYYRIRAINNSGASLYTAVESTFTLPAPPAAPTGLSATAVDENTIDLTWTDTNNENSYTIERSLTSGAGFTEVTTLSANTTYYRNGGLTEGTRYYYRIYATNPGGNSGFSNEASATTDLAPPTNLAATALDEQSIRLTWTDVSTHETGYKIERSLTSGSGFTQFHVTTANVTTYTNVGLAENTEYFYRIRAAGTAGDSEYSNVAGATTDLSVPDAPAGLNFTGITTSSIRLNWDDRSNNEEGFEIRRSPTLTGTYTLIHTTAENIETYNNIGLDDDTEYFYRVNAVNDAGPSATISGSATTLLSLPVAPGNLTFSNITTNSIQLSWDDLSDNESGFEIRRSQILAGPYTLVHTTAENIETYNDTGLDEETVYFYRVNAVNATGPSTYISGNTSTLLSVPDAPVGLNFTDITTGSIRLNWDDQSDNEDGFEIRRSQTLTGTYTLIQTTAENIETYNNIGLTDDTEYFYRVNAVNDAGPSTSISGNATTLLAVPDAPTNLKGDATNICSVELTWKDNSDNEDGFEIYRRLGTTGAYILIETLPADTESYTDTDTQNGFTYYYRLNAFNDTGPSAVASVNVPISVALDGGSIGPAQELCPGDDPALIQNLVSPSGGSNNWTYQWQSRIAPAVFADINGATGITFNPPAGMTETTEFVRISTVECGSVPSNTVIIKAEDLEEPVFESCPEDMLLVVERNEVTGEVDPPDPVVTDFCGIEVLTWTMTGATVASSPLTGINNVGLYVFNLGVTTVTYHAEDLTGNFAECSFDVTVEKKKPEVQNVTIQNTPMNIGDRVTATITVADDGGSEYNLVSGSIGGYELDIASMERTNSTTYLATFTIEENGTSYAASASIPVSNVVVTDGTDPSMPYSKLIIQNLDAIDASRPVIQSMTVASGIKKIGDQVILTIDADAPGYAIREDSSWINGILAGEPNITFTDIGSGFYRLSYVVEEGDRDVGPGELTAIIRLSELSGNSSLPYSVVGNVDQLTIDAHPPVVTRMEVPDEEVGVGGTVQVTIIADSVGYAVATGTTINGVPLSSPRVTFSERTGGLYELAYVVDAVDGEVAPGNLQVSLILSDPAGNNSEPYNDLESNTLEVYTELPTAVLAGTPEICEDEAAELTLYLQGRGPWSFSLYDGSDTAKFNNIAEDNFDLTVAPERTTTYSIPVVMDRNGVKNTGSGSIRVTVYEKTDVQITNLASGYSLEADPVRLQANVPGGIFSGPGVIMISGSPYFDPALADTLNSPHTIIYTYTNSNGCVSEASRLVFVLGAEGDVYIPSSVVCANGDPFMVNASNIAGVNGSFRLLNAGSQPVEGLTDNGDNSAEVDPALLVPGAYTIEYAYFDEVTLYIRRVFTVESVSAPVIKNLVDDTYCQNTDPFLLQSSVSNTVFEGPGVSLTFEGFVFTPRDVKPGMITIIATTSSEHGCTASSQRDVEILFTPETKFSISTSCIPEEGGTVSFENLTSGKLEVETWDWDFGDPESGENNQSGLVNPKHFYSTQGEFSISLTATTYEGCMDTYLMDTTVGNMPVADYTVLSDCFANGDGIKFINRSTSLSSPGDSLVWTFSTNTGGVLGEIRVDAFTDTVAFPFVTVDSYRVGLAAVNSMGCVDTVTREITLRPTIRLTTEGYDEQFNESEALWTIQSNDGVESWTWDVPDFDGFIQTPGDKGWFTQLPYGAVGYMERSWIQSPCFDFTGMKRPVIKLDIMKSFVPGLNGAVLQYMDVNEEGWKTLGADTPGINWYNVSTIYNQPGGSSTGWGLNVFNPDTDWVTAIHDLNNLVGNRNVTFRLAIATTGAQGIGNQGFAFDNVTIAERSKRAVLEHFTNSSDVSSRSADDIIDAFGKTYAKDLVDLQYHMDYPGSDPMHDNNPSPPSTREFFYGVPQVPYAILDGGTESSYRYDFSELKTTPSADQINLVSLEIPAFDIDIEVDWMEGSLEATTTVTCVTDQYENNIQLYMVVFESLVTAYNGINGDTEFRNVVLDMMPTAAGRLLGGNWYRNVKDIRTDTWTYAPYVEDVADLGVAAFVQDRNTGRILQAAVNYKTPQVGIGNQPAGLRNLHVYPNPARHSVYVNLGSRTEHSGMIRLTDMSGRVVITENIPAGYQIYQLDIQHLNHGMYVLEWIESARIRGLSKIVKAR